MNDNTDIANPVAKAVTSVAAAGFAGYTWSDFAAMAATIYTCILIGEWVWKRLIKPGMLRRRGIKPNDGTDFGGLS